ncbi:MAG: peroxiredoxin [Chitinophagaceae bacterium]
MSLRLGDIAPDFIATTTIGEINFYEFLGSSWGVLFSHPADFTPVCTTELGRTAQLQDEFAKRNVKVLALSVDPLDSHLNWVKDINETQHVAVGFPIIADVDKKIANLYGMIHPNASETFTVRSLFVIGPDKKIKLTITYPASTGRNFVEVLRVIDSLQLTANYSEVVIIAGTIKTEDIPAKFPKGHKIIKPYLRTTPQPNK